MPTPRTRWLHYYDNSNAEHERKFGGDGGLFFQVASSSTDIIELGLLEMVCRLHVRRTECLSQKYDICHKYHFQSPDRENVPRLLSRAPFPELQTTLRGQSRSPTFRQIPTSCADQGFSFLPLEGASMERARPAAPRLNSFSLKTLTSRAGIACVSTAGAHPML